MGYTYYPLVFTNPNMQFCGLLISEPYISTRDYVKIISCCIQSFQNIHSLIKYSLWKSKQKHTS